MFCHEAVPGEKLHLQEQTQNHSIGLKLCSVGNWLRYAQVPLAMGYAIRGTHQGSHDCLSHLTKHLLHDPAGSKQVGLEEPFLPLKHSSCCPAQAAGVACQPLPQRPANQGHGTHGQEPLGHHSHLTPPKDRTRLLAPHHDTTLWTSGSWSPEPQPRDQGCSRGSGPGPSPRALSSPLLTSPAPL